ncbi:MAG TPA: hypothetical protein VD736_08385 [Nitrososphaera sp.]|nr:hypothetical protein [Nitrososphaera sp.]
MGIGAGIIAGIALAGIYAVTYLQSTVVAEPPKIVTVSGKVSVFFDTKPISVVFHDLRSDKTESVDVDGTQYRIALPNGNYNWRVIVLWQSLGIPNSNGQCDAGYITYQNTLEPRIEQDISC